MTAKPHDDSSKPCSWIDHRPARNPWLAALVVLGLGLALLPGEASCDPADWPQFRGPHRDGISAEKGLVDGWGEGGPPVLWRSRGGEGYSALSVAGGRLFTLLARGNDELAVAFDATSGRELWTYRLGDKYNNDFGDGPRSTPTVDGDTVYVLSARGHLAALETATGKARWSQDLTKSLGARIPTWGISTSPLVLGDLLLVDAGGRDGASVAALNKRDGVMRWTAGTDIAGYSAPLPIRVGGLEQVVFFTGTQVVGVSPKDGKILWQEAWRTSYDVNAAAPVFIAPDRLFISSGYDTGSALYRVQVAEGAASLQEVWRNRAMKNQFSSSIYLDGHLYGFDNSILKCLDAATGEERWKARGYGHGSLTYADGKLIVLSDRGKLALLEATPAAYRELASHELFAGKTWTVPTLAGGVLYVRDEKELVALKLTGTTPEKGK
jgi:outer membrane protein assembly factor BamB